MTENFDLLYKTLLESASNERGQQGGFMGGDRITFQKDTLKHEYFKNVGQSLRDLVASCMEKDFDKILRISVLKSIYPTTSQNYRGGTEAPDGIFADVVIEGNPGFYTSPMTVPIGVLVLHTDGGGRGPVPDSLKRKEKLNDPEKYKTKKTDGKEDDHINYASSDTKIAGGNKWDDTKPGSGSYKM